MPDDNKMKPYDIALLALVFMLFVFGALAFFVSPKYEKGAEVALAAVVEGIGSILSFKFGVHVATPPPGTSQITQTQIPPAPVPEKSVA